MKHLLLLALVGSGASTIGVPAATAQQTPDVKPAPATNADPCVQRNDCISYHQIDWQIRHDDIVGYWLDGSIYYYAWYDRRHLLPQVYQYAATCENIVDAQYPPGARVPNDPEHLKTARKEVLVRVETCMGDFMRADPWMKSLNILPTFTPRSSIPPFTVQSVAGRP